MNEYFDGQEITFKYIFPGMIIVVPFVTETLDFSDGSIVHLQNYGRVTTVRPGWLAVTTIEPQD